MTVKRKILGVGRHPRYGNLLELFRDVEFKRGRFPRLCTWSATFSFPKREDCRLYQHCSSLMPERYGDATRRANEEYKYSLVWGWDKELLHKGSSKNRICLTLLSSTRHKEVNRNNIRLRDW